MRSRACLASALALALVLPLAACTSSAPPAQVSEYRTPLSPARTHGPAAPTHRPAAQRCGATQAAFTSNRLRAVGFASPTLGWVLAADRILVTRDGGTRWHTALRSPGARFTSLDVVDPTHAWAVGSHVLVRTVDGHRWTRLPEPCAGLQSVSFRTDANGVGVSGGAHAVLLGTHDGGRHWHRLPGPSDVHSVCFDSRTVGWLGTRGRVFYTDTAGRHWRAAPGSFVTRTAYSGGVTVQCAGRDEGWAEWVSDGGAMSQSPHVGFHLRSGRATPVFAEQFFPDRKAGTTRSSPGSYPGPFTVLDRRSAVFVDACAACATRLGGHPSRTLVESAPLSVATRSGRDLSTPIPVTSLSSATGVSFVGPDDGWIVGNRTLFTARSARNHTSAVLLHTTDGGRTWVRQLTIQG